MIASIFKILAAGLSLWNTKESRKYLDQVIQLKQDWYDEFNKQNCDDGRLDRIEQRLLIISDAFCSQVGTENAKNK